MVESSRAREAEERKWDAKPLKEVCERTVWRDDVIFECLPDPDPGTSPAYSFSKVKSDRG